MSDKNKIDDDSPKMKYIAYVGCYTSPKQADPFRESLGGVPHDESKIGNGILALGITYEGKLRYLKPEDPVVVVKSVVPNPSYLVVLNGISTGHNNSQQRLLCVVSEVGDDGDEGKEGKMFVFAIDPRDPTKLKQVGEALPTGGSLPCHITGTGGSSNKEDYLFVSNYGNGKSPPPCGPSWTIYRIQQQGDNMTTTVTTMQTIPHLGQGSNRALFDRQASPHVHCSCIISNDGSSCGNSIRGSDNISSGCMDNNDILVTDLGADAIVRYGFRRNGGGDKMMMAEVGRLALPLGSGPRSIALNPKANFSHVVGAVSLEMSAQVLLVRCRKHDGCLEMLGQPISVLPPDWPPEDRDNTMSRFNKGKWLSDVVWSNDGRYLFAAARLHNSISVFELVIDDDKFMRLVFRHRIASGGKTPRCLTVSNLGEFLLVAHQHSHDVSSFQIDQRTGMLTFVNKIEAPLAACIKMVSPGA